MNHGALLLICAATLGSLGLIVMAPTSADRCESSTDERDDEEPAAQAFTNKRQRPVRKSMFGAKPEDWQSISNPQAITILSIVGLGDDVDDGVLKNLTRFPNTKSLLLSSPSITNDCLKHILAMRKLEVLVIYGDAITDSGVQQLKELPSLEVIGLHCSAVTAKGVNALNEILPSAYIELWPSVRREVFDHNGCITPEFANEHL